MWRGKETVKRRNNSRQQTTWQTSIGLLGSHAASSQMYFMFLPLYALSTSSQMCFIYLAFYVQPVSSCEARVSCVLYVWNGPSFQKGPILSQILILIFAMLPFKARWTDALIALVGETCQASWPMLTGTSIARVLMSSKHINAFFICGAIGLVRVQN